MQVDNFASTMPYVATIILAGIVLWIYAVISLGKIINNTIKDSDPSSKTDVDEQVIGQQPKNINLSMSYN
jgi:ATP/ADP translocase